MRKNREGRGSNQLRNIQAWCIGCPLFMLYYACISLHPSGRLTHVLREPFAISYSFQIWSLVKAFKLFEFLFSWRCHFIDECDCIYCLVRVFLKQVTKTPLLHCSPFQSDLTFVQVIMLIVLCCRACSQKLKQNFFKGVALKAPLWQKCFCGCWIFA